MGEQCPPGAGSHFWCYRHTQIPGALIPAPSLLSQTCPTQFLSPRQLFTAKGPEAPRRTCVKLGTPLFPKNSERREAPALLSGV